MPPTRLFPPTSTACRSCFTLEMFSAAEEKTPKDNKIKIGSSEDGEPRYVFKLKSETRAEVMLDGEIVGRVKFYPEKKRIKVKSASNQTLYRIKTDRMRLGFGALLLEAVPARERFVLLGEMLSRNW